MTDSCNSVSWNHTYNIEQTKQHREEFLYVSTAIGISKTYTMYDGNKNSG